VAELAARDVARELGLPCGVQGRRELQRRQALLAARVVREALHRELRGRCVEVELVGSGAAGARWGEERRIQVVACGGRRCEAEDGEHEASGERR
jgi:hypothetical protein